MAKAKSKPKALTAAEIKKKYNSGTANEMVVAGDDALWLPSRFIALNQRLGGGILYGRILELFGEESSGKTLLAYDFAEVCIELGGIVLWVDAEAAYTAHWSETLGLDNDRVILFQEQSVEKISDWINDQVTFWRSELTNNEPILLVTDSTAALDSEVNINSSQVDAKAEMGNRAKAIYKMLRIRNGKLDALGVCSIFINQIRKKVGAGMFEDPDTTPGGKALAYYASQRVKVAKGKQIKKKISGKERRIGNECHIRVIKNKVAPPSDGIKGAEVYFNDKYVDRVGFNSHSGLADILVDEGVLTKKAGSSRYYLKEDMLANGEEALMKLLEKDEKLCKKLIRKSGVNTFERLTKTLKKLEENLYPID